MPSPEEPEVPDDAEYLWTWFRDLSAQRAHGEHGPQPLSFTDMLAWSKLSGHRPNDEEWTVILGLDRALIEVVATERREAIEAEREKAERKAAAEKPTRRTRRR